MKAIDLSGFHSGRNGVDPDRLSRRRLFAAAAGVAAGCLASAVPAAPAASPRSPKTRPRDGREMKVGLYSITFLGLWYRGKGLPLDEVVRRAKHYGYDGLEIDGKRPHGNPLDWPRHRCLELRKLADGEGIDLYAVAADNVNGQTVGIEYAENNAQLACEYAQAARYELTGTELDFNYQL